MKYWLSISIILTLTFTRTPILTLAFALWLALTHSIIDTYCTAHSNIEQIKAAIEYPSTVGNVSILFPNYYEILDSGTDTVLTACSTQTNSTVRTFYYYIIHMFSPCLHAFFPLPLHLLFRTWLTLLPLKLEDNLFTLLLTTTFRLILAGWRIFSRVFDGIRWSPFISGFGRFK